MKTEEARTIIGNERLVSYSLFEDRGDASDEIVIKRVSGGYTVYATNERGSKISGGERIFRNEEDALDHFIKRLRALNQYRNRLEKRG